MNVCYPLFSPVYPDNAMQVCFEVSLLGFLISWMVSADLRGPLGWDHNVRGTMKNQYVQGSSYL